MKKNKNSQKSQTSVVSCKICENEYKQITQLHLRGHDTNLDKYTDRFPDADIIPPINCENCGELVDDKMSLRAKYCDECADIIHRRNVLQAVRRYNKRVKNLIRNEVHNANMEYGVITDKRYMTEGDTRISHTHAYWNYIPNLRDEVGTLNDYDLSVNEKTGRIRAIEKLNYREVKEKIWKNP